MKNGWDYDTLQLREKPALPFMNTGVMPPPKQTEGGSSNATPSLEQMSQDQSNAPKPIVVVDTTKKDADDKGSANTDIVKKALETSKANMNGILIGAGVGVLYCFMTKKNYLHGALFGGIMGGLASYSYTKIKTK